MPALLIARVCVNDPEAYKDYMLRSGPAVAAFGGRFVVRGTTPEVLEGEDDGLRTVVAEFPDMETARRWHGSQQYTEARGFRAPPVADATFLLFETSEPVGKG
ncbi:MAG: DUF1330 domain-containing protein [Roseovarius sp.]|jgi:uncharacterized protein (DUF1330 family)|nr:DUF1330 domain-containing protein [Roseovarius sp.]